MNMRAFSRLVAIGLVAVATTAQQEPTNLNLFLLIGQSNMAGRGTIEAQDRTPIPAVFMLNKDLKWVPAIDPMHFDKPDIVGVGLGRSFAKVLTAAKPGAQIGLIPAAFGGTSLDQWKVGDKLYNDAVQRTKVAMQTGTLRGILWHQGEADSNTEANARSYADRFTIIISALRKELGAEDVPIVLGELGRFWTAKNPHAAIVNAQQAVLPLTLHRTAYATSEGLTDRGDATHFNTEGFRELGRRYGLAFLSLDPGWK
jgi:hypothetical protein